MGLLHSLVQFLLATTRKITGEILLWRKLLWQDGAFFFQYLGSLIVGGGSGFSVTPMMISWCPLPNAARRGDTESHQ